MSPKDAVSGAHFPGKVLELTNSRVQGRTLELCTSAPGSVGAGAMMVPRWWGRWLGRWWDEQTVSASETVAGGIWLTLPPSCHTDTRLCALWPFMPHYTTPYHTIPYHAPCSMRQTHRNYFSDPQILTCWRRELPQNKFTPWPSCLFTQLTRE